MPGPPVETTTFRGGEGAWLVTTAGDVDVFCDVLWLDRCESHDPQQGLGL